MSGPARPVRIGLTLGDWNGVGPEIALFAAQAVRGGAFPGVELALIGSGRALLPLAAALRIACPPPLDPRRDPVRVRPGVRLWDPAPHLAPERRPGRIEAEASAAAGAWIEAAADACRDGRLDAMVTGPVCKEGLRLAGIGYPGQTEWLAERLGARRFAMMLIGGPLRVVLATRHIPLRAVPDALTPGVVLDAVVLAAQALDWLGVAGGRVGVCGVNPHAGDGGVLGGEDRETVAPAVAAARRMGIRAAGPLSGDAAFLRAARGEFDAIVAMYHDQGLAPLKLAGFESGVNLTLGLPIVRTSPAHGTAFDLAGTGRASPESLFAAIRTAARLAQRTPPWNAEPGAGTSAAAR